MSGIKESARRAKQHVPEIVADLQQQSERLPEAAAA